MRQLVILVAVVACGGKAREPEKPKPPGPDPKRVAAQIEHDASSIAEVASRLRGNCHDLLVELPPVIARMRSHADEAVAMQRDPELGVVLKAELKTYDQRALGRADRIAEDLAATYRACTERTDKEQLAQLVEQIPTFK
jgi:hypothetical protein